MNTRLWSIVLVTTLTLLLLGVAVTMAQEQTPQTQPNDNQPSTTIAHTTTYTYTYNTVITVTSGTDPDSSKSYTCSSPPADGLCTLRRAIVESRNLSSGDKPVLIKFAIPQESVHGYDSILEIWKIQVQSTSDASVFRRIKGDVIIDGATQPNGRATGPKIFVVGPGTGQKDGPIVGDVAGDDNIQIYGLAFQNFKTHLYINTNNNVVQSNWFGLNNEGIAPYLRDDNAENGSGNTGVSFNGSPTGNVVQDNVFLGFDGVAAAIRGDENTFKNNWIGTNASGSLTKQTDPGLVCTTVDWLGGGGISVADEGNRIEDNVFAGLRQEVFAITTQPDTIRIDGDAHVIQNNKIGVDATDTEVGVCGRGIYLAGADTPDHTQVFSNTIVNPEMSAISINGLSTDANILRNNVIKKTAAWPQIEGSPAPEDAIQFGPSVPDALKDFVPAQVTNIDGLTVSGSNGTGSACPNCTIELFLDDSDAIIEALQSLAVTTADGSGNWTATLPAELESGQAIRTTSTTAQYNTISGKSAGTTTKLSELYQAKHVIFLPLMIK